VATPDAAPRIAIFSEILRSRSTVTDRAAANPTSDPTTHAHLDWPKDCVLYPQAGTALGTCDTSIEALLRYGSYRIQIVERRSRANFIKQIITPLRLRSDYG